MAPEQHNEAEQQKILLEAQEKAVIVNAFNNRFAATLGTGTVSQEISLANHLVSIMVHFVKQQKAADPGLKQRLNAPARTLLNLSQGKIIGSCLGVLSLVGLETGIATEAMTRLIAAVLHQAERSFDGADRIQTKPNSRFNLSFLSNATRLSAEQSDEEASCSAFTLGASARVSENLALRSLLVSLCQSRNIFPALTQIYEEEKKIAPPEGIAASMRATVASPNRFAEAIKDILDQAEEGHEIPGLNHDVVSQLRSLTDTGVFTSSLVHTMTASYLRCRAALLEAAQIDEQARQEALTGSLLSRKMSMALNAIQNFTHNAIKVFDRQAENDLPVDQPSLIGGQLSSNRSQALSDFYACHLTLLLDEFMETVLSRFLTLIDWHQSVKSSEKIKEVAQKDSAWSLKGIQQDSQGKHHSQLSQILSALRRTFSHLGVSLGDYASQLADEFDKAMVVRPGIKEHRYQQSMINTIVSCGSALSTAGTQASAIISRLPLSSGQSIKESVNLFTLEIAI